jgi:hypothetical protein
MKRIERDLGRPIEWAAVNHHDTDHPHAHIVMRGVDLDGRELRLDRRYITQGIRWRAQELATRELGPRLEVDVQRARVREVSQERYTSLDRDIERCARDGGVELRALHQAVPKDRSLLVGRLEQLERLGIAERAAPGEWSLADGWPGRLRDLGERGDILKEIHRAMGGVSYRSHIVRAGQSIPECPAGGALWGRVAGKGLTDELRGAFFAVLETPAGTAYHLPISRATAEALKVGEIVSFATRAAPTGRTVSRVRPSASGSRSSDTAVTWRTR